MCGYKLVPFLFGASLVFGALPSTGVIEVRTAGSNNNGGGFDASVASPGTDFSQQNSAQIAFTDLVIGATTTQFTSVAHPVDSTFPGNYIKIVSGTGCTVGWYRIASQAASVATVDRSMGTAASTCTANLGGAVVFSSINTGVVVVGNIVWMKADATYSISGLNNINNWSDSNTPTILAGYTTTRGDDGKITLQATGATTNVIDLNAPGTLIRNVIADCNSQTNTFGFYMRGQFGSLYNVKASKCSQSGIAMAQAAEVCVRCWVDQGTGSNAFDMTNLQNSCTYCAATANAGAGFSMGNDSYCNFCFSISNTGASTDGFAFGGHPIVIMNSVAYGNGRDGMRGTVAGSSTLTNLFNNVMMNNAGYGLNNTNSGVWTAAVKEVLMSNAFYNNTLGARNNAVSVPTDVTLTADPFTNAAGGDFSLNSTAGGGAALKAAGYPGVMPYGGTGYMSIGVLQPQQAVTSSGGAFGYVQ